MRDRERERGREGSNRYPLCHHAATTPPQLRCNINANANTNTNTNANANTNTNTDTDTPLTPRELDLG